MTAQAANFLQVMAGAAVIGIAAFVIALLASAGRRAPAAATAIAPAGDPGRWAAHAIALILTLIVAALLVWRFAPFGMDPQSAAETAGAWRAGTRSQAFFLVMIAVGVIGLLACAAIVFFRILPADSVSPRARAHARGETESAADQPVPAPPAARLGGLAILALAFLLLGWIYLSHSAQHALVARALYPAAIAVALVLLFDKATRAWAVKPASAVVREWMFCDGFTFLLVLGFLNALTPEPEVYSAMVVDMAGILLFFFAFWITDRKLTRLRFLVAYACLALAPLLLVIWQAVQGIAAPETLSWWETPWPFLVLALIGGALEVIALLAARDAERHIGAGIKDAVFFVVYGILLITAIPQGA